MAGQFNPALLCKIYFHNMHDLESMGVRVSCISPEPTELLGVPVYFSPWLEPGQIAMVDRCGEMKIVKLERVFDFVPGVRGKTQLSLFEE